MTTTYDAVDLFAGPGGWDVAAQSLGLHTIGIEFDAAACATRRAAGLPTVEGDVRHYGPSDFPARGFIASPPCQTFSMAGKGAGRAALDIVLGAVKLMGARETVDLSAFADERTGLVLEPLRWALQAIDGAAAYEWLAFEQVPTVLPVWEAMADVLRAEGYSVATGNLHAEQYGVPQTRKRAVLVARLDGEAKLPTPTHSKYYSRTPERLDAGVLKCVSMADALGWGMTDRPYFSVVAGTDAGGTDPQAIGASTSRRAIDAERAAGRWVEKVHADGPETWARPFTRQTETTAPRQPSGNRNDGARLSINEAAVLQSFPCDHPWQGGKSPQFQQAANAIPPLLARAVLTSTTN